MQIDYMSYGAQVAERFSRSGDSAELLALLADAKAKDGNIRQAGGLALTSALMCLASGLRKSEQVMWSRDKLQFSERVPSPEEVSYVAGRSATHQEHMTQKIIAFARALRSRYPEWHLTAVSSSERNKPEPLDMRIVSLPERVTTTSVERDKNDNIVTTMQVEKDST